MNNPKIDFSLEWSPHRDNEFILYANNILIYRISSFDGSQGFKTRTNIYFILTSFICSRLVGKNRIDSNLVLADNSYAKLIGTKATTSSPNVK